MDHRNLYPARAAAAACLTILIRLAAAANPADATQSPPATPLPPHLPPQQMTGIGMSAAGNVQPAPEARSAASRRPPWITYYYTYEQQAGFDPDTINFPYDKVIMHDTFLQLAFPVYLRPEWRVFSGVDLQWTQFDFQGGGDPEKYSETRNLFACGVPIRVSASLPKDWTGTLMAAPAVYSDMEDVDSGAWRFTGLALGGVPLVAAVEFISRRGLRADHGPRDAVPGGRPDVGSAAGLADQPDVSESGRHLHADRASALHGNDYAFRERVGCPQGFHG